MQNLIKHLLRSIGISVLALTLYQGLILLYPNLAHREFYVFVFFFFLQEFLSGFLARHFSNGEDQQKATLVFFIITGFRMVLAMALALAIVLRFPEQKMLLSLSFVCLYFYFLIVETTLMVKYLANKNK